jgi:hypothetical protein
MFQPCFLHFLVAQQPNDGLFAIFIHLDKAGVILLLSAIKSRIPPCGYGFLKVELCTAERAENAEKTIKISAFSAHSAVERFLRYRAQNCQLI